MLSPHLEDAGIIEQLSAELARAGRLRISNVLDPAAASALLEAQRRAPFILRGHRADRVGWQQGPATGLDLQYWQHVIDVTDTSAAEDGLAAFGRWVFSDGLRWLEQLTGLPLAPPADGRLIATSYAKGSYLDAHNDYDGERRLALVFGFTPTPIPAEHGGQLEFISLAGGAAQVEMAFAPGFNTLDLFEVFERPPIHRVTLVRAHVERRAITCWLYRR